MRIHSVVPNFTAETTKGPISFYDWMGNSWCILFSHPGDFTPVGTTELGHFAEHQSFFERRNVKLLAHSVGKLENHNKWIKDILASDWDIHGNFPFPIIADPKREIAVLLDMINIDKTKCLKDYDTDRVLYLIGPDKTLRLSMYYPESTGRSVYEIIRVVDSVQLTDRLKIVATPANWNSGEEIMILPTADNDEIKKLFPNSSVKCYTLPSGFDYLRSIDDYDN